MRSTAFVLFLAACSSSTPPPQTPAGGGAAAGAVLAGSSLTPADVAGHYSGQWGQLLLREVNGELRATYSHDEGTIVGTLQGDTFVGWWCEVPSRKPTQDAGDVELKFVRDAADAMKIDGRWRYGADGDWRDDWDIERDGAEPDPALVQRFEDAAAFCPKPQ